MLRVKRWAKVEDYSPLSPQQFKKYLLSKGYKIPIDRKTQKASTNKEAMRTLLRRYGADPVITLTQEGRQLNKALSYLDEGVISKHDGKIHSTYTCAPDTGRLASMAPNLQNVPHHGVDQELVDAIRSTIIAPPGHLLVEFDWKAIEAVLTGWFANDPDFIRVSLMDSHSLLGWHFLAGLALEWKVSKPVAPPPALNDPNLDALIKSFRKEWGEFVPLQGEPMTLRDLSKKVNHATSYGMGPNHLGALLHISPFEAVKLLKIKDNMAPRVKEWKKAVLLQAHSQGYLENPFGYRRCFFNAVELDKDGNPSVGEEANKVYAFFGQSTAAGMLREVLLQLPSLSGYGNWWRPLVPIHDAILFEVEEDFLGDLIKLIKPVMEKPWPELAGLSITVDIKSGPNWAEMK